MISAMFYFEQQKMGFKIWDEVRVIKTWDKTTKRWAVCTYRPWNEGHTGKISAIHTFHDDCFMISWVNCRLHEDMLEKVGIKCGFTFD